VALIEYAIGCSQNVGSTRFNKGFVREIVETFCNHILRTKRNVSFLEVSAGVVFKSALLVEPLAAKARKRLDTRVSQHVPVELGLAQESRPALNAQMFSSGSVPWTLGRTADASFAVGRSG
jgi:hypothetical protein